MKLIIGHLYPELMNIYGDMGNIIALQKRAEWRGIEVVIKKFSIENKLKQGKVDLFFFGGGQDQAQELVAGDLVASSKGKIIKKEVEKGVPLLAICGGYQLLGEYYQPHNATKLTGIGVFPAYTVAGDNRMIGNIVVQSSWFTVHGQEETSMNNELPAKHTMNYLVGFENHSGKTFLKEGAQPLGQVVKGFGNNGEDQTEGCIYKNAVGSYMHGSLLPKNPGLADWLLTKALELKYGKEIALEPLDNTLENLAHKAAVLKYS
ncbi:glutamine amidotransferase [Candidatus Daviesbacteria bacterium RIFCSPLOWO2_01_FULL_43_38]|uniref:Lipid II isoglutaminyl synthase (glutamine-hydrolyzing) subunit GatD n=3 Tax=Candidatus Daviesiibacteriota TaxID=1752718 RepID=A0A1F5K431_9BACT|nr:MAG: CobB/CobQ domain protein glutamine amidotransferase [Candidatus Daviesbacteria bacterium GW2011_GWA1_42_6]KKS71064.1 MAG: CobB/CobQ domain protein glutamine amidotransferase [Candidatus Daviesbacteria bacterium GW2011_GWA2_42_7]OGE19982.1 MAG: glutamine amidotransferase [Candidatus Daviesbacteria bacterium RIFCSPHIGHO2_01_FULL_43_17]OGE35732.1 MAG: glutamine amidotransferase [Candidatus Daviesbacteria bacterium RIFCSPHIGHO2_12_FULL_43_11]OGE63420.1 MAG: glutamine amidotransferase [Candi